MENFLTLDMKNISAKIGSPPKEDLISGNPTNKSWSLDEPSEDLGCGIWESTPGKWHFENAHWEYCHILEGVSIITEDSGHAHLVKAGEGFVLRAGFKGTWEVIETTKKEYVFRDQKNKL